MTHRTIIIAIIFAAFGFSNTVRAETRCGWVMNPTPGNWSLIDASGEWFISAQAGEEAQGMENLPDFTEGEWVVTNGSSYGYGCTCMDVDADAGDGLRIYAIRSVKQLPLSRCEADSNLPSP